MDLTEAEDIKKRWQEYTELKKKYLQDQDNHDGVITHLEPDILESEVKWALGRITMNKDGIPVELFQILKDDAVKVLHSISQQIWKTQQWPQNWKSSVFIPIPQKSESESHAFVSDSFQPHGLYSPVHGILQARILEWVALPFFQESSQLRDRTQVSHMAGGFFTS